MAHEYVETYLENLPNNLRPTNVSDKVLDALRLAWRNKWDAKELAQAVAADNFSTSTNPAGSAVRRLTAIAQQKPYRPTPTTVGGKVEACKHGEPKGADWCAFCTRGIEPAPHLMPD